MIDVEAQLLAYGQAVGRALTDVQDADVPEKSPPSRQSGPRRRWPLVLGAAAAALVLIVWAGVRTGDNQQVSVANRAGIFPTRTDTVLVFTGNEDLVILDLDTGETVRQPIEGNRAGDHPFWLAEVDQHFVVGVDEIWAAPFGQPPRRIDDATIFLPSAEPDAVWTIDYAGTSSYSSAEVRLVTTSGEVLVNADGFDGERYEPFIGVPGGLAVRDRETAVLAVWDPDTREAVPVASDAHIGLSVGTRPDRLDGDHVVSNGELIAWCSDACADLHVQGLQRTGQPTAHAASWTRRLAISADGELIATQTDSRLTIFERGSDGGYEPVHQYPIEERGSIQWTNDGSQLFYSRAVEERRSLSGYDSSTRALLGRYDNRTGRWTAITLDDIDYFPGAIIALDRSDARPLLGS